MTRRDETDFRRIADIVAGNVEEWVGIGTFLILAQQIQHNDSTRSTLSHIQAQLATISNKLTEMESRIMATIDDLVADEAALRTELGNLIALVQQLQAGQGLTAEQQAAVDALDASLKQDTADVQAAENPPPPTP